MSDYINTGKKVKPNCDEWEDITYNKVYDVFTDGDNEFIIDDVGDWRYLDKDNFDFHKWYELVDDTVNTDNTIVETNHKFKEGDKVMVVNTDYISTYTDGVTVGDIGTVIGVFEVGVDKYHVNFKDTDYECYWFFTDKCIELVGDKHDNGGNYILDDDEQTKQQFSVGDKVKVKSISTLPSDNNHGASVGDIAEIIGVRKIGTMVLLI